MKFNIGDNLNTRSALNKLGADLVYGLSEIQIRNNLAVYGCNIVGNNYIVSNIKSGTSYNVDKTIKWMSIISFIWWMCNIIIIATGNIHSRLNYIVCLIAMISIYGIVLIYYYFNNTGHKIEVNYPNVSTRVVRNGVVDSLNSDFLVAGDLVLLRKGDIVPADIMLIESDCIKCDECIFTGIPKNIIKKSYDDEIISNRVLYAGSEIVCGVCSGIVINVGKNTRLMESYVK